MTEDEELEYLRDMLAAYKAMDENINETINSLTTGMTKDQMKEVFRQMNSSYLQMILEEIALVKENYEVCQAIKEIMEERL